MTGSIWQRLSGVAECQGEPIHQTGPANHTTCELTASPELLIIAEASTTALSLPSRRTQNQCGGYLLGVLSSIYRTTLGTEAFGSVFLRQDN
jgi:hypothetical protein